MSRRHALSFQKNGEVGGAERGDLSDQNTTCSGSDKKMPYLPLCLFSKHKQQPSAANKSDFLLLLLASIPITTFSSRLKTENPKSLKSRSKNRGYTVSTQVSGATLLFLCPQIYKLRLG